VFKKRQQERDISTKMIERRTGRGKKHPAYEWNDSRGKKTTRVPVDSGRKENFRNLEHLR